jgi:hypothetical protein
MRVFADCMDIEIAYYLPFSNLIKKEKRGFV